MNNPFTLTFGREPINRIDRLEQKDYVVNSFESNPPSNQVCMVTGVRGSGKTVFLTEIGKYFASKEDWITIDLTPERDLLQSFAAELYNYTGMTEIFKRAKLNLPFLGIGVEIDGTDPIKDMNIAIKRMLQHTKDHGKKVLVTIDEAICNKTMKEFVSVFQIYMRQDLSVFLLMSGLYEKIYELQNEDTLTFLYRAPKIELQPLNISMIATRYQAIFNLTDEDARNMAKETRGYAFAFQVLGYLTWNAKASWRTVLPEYRQYLEEFVYNKIWSEISAKDREVLFGVLHSENHKVSTIRETLQMSSSAFSIYRNRLIKKGILNGDVYGYLAFALPQFEEFLRDMD